MAIFVTGRANRTVLGFSVLSFRRLGFVKVGASIRREISELERHTRGSAQV